MFYKFNQLTQNLVSTTQDVALGRVVTAQASLGTLSESPIHYEYKPLQIPVTSRQVSSGAISELGPGKYPVPNTKRYKKLMDLQTKFLANDGKLVWQKLPLDKPLYYIAIGMAIVCVGMTAQGIYKLVSPPKNQ